MARPAPTMNPEAPPNRLAEAPVRPAPPSDHDPQRQIRQLQTRIARLEAAAAKHRQIQEALHEMQQRYASLVENIPDVVYSLDEEGNILTMNQAARNFGYDPSELVGRPMVDLIHPLDRHRVVQSYCEVVAKGQDYCRTQKFRILTPCGETRWLEANCAIRFTPAGRFILQEGVCRDITDNTVVEQHLLETRDILEQKVRRRTSELLQTNAELQREIEERRTMEKILRDRERDLQVEKTNLEETNTALRVLLKRREADKAALQEQVMYNVKKLVLPYLNKVRKEIHDERQKTCLGIAEANLGDLTCSFSRRLSLSYYGLTVSELKVADFIRKGKKTKEIANLLGLSPRTVEAFRQSIRKKLMLQNKKVNLRTFLMSIK